MASIFDCLGCQHGSILASKILPNPSKNRSQDALNFWSILASIFNRFGLYFGSQLWVPGPQEGPKKRPGCVFHIDPRTHFLALESKKAPKSDLGRFLMHFWLIVGRCLMIRWSIFGHLLIDFWMIFDWFVCSIFEWILIDFSLNFDLILSTALQSSETRHRAFRSEDSIGKWWTITCSGSLLVSAGCVLVPLTYTVFFDFSSLQLVAISFALAFAL